MARKGYSLTAKTQQIFCEAPMTTQSKADIFRALVEKKTTGPMVRKKARRLGYVKLPDQINLSYSRL